MDEFFNFEDAAHPVDRLEHPTPAPFDLDQALAELAQGEDHLSQFNSYVDALPQDNSVFDQMNFDLAGSAQDTAMMGPDDFTDFPRWIDGMDVPTKPCEYCSQRRIHCKVIREGTRKGSCTSCVALAKTCSLTADLKSPIARIDSFPVAYTAEDERQNTSSRDLDPHSHSGSASSLVAMKSSSENLAEGGESTSNPKVGARFSREALRVLRSWLTANHRHPYPTDEEKDSLARQTGLNKTQITNWLANARRRGKVRAPRSTSPSPHQYANGIDIPRRGTPAMKEMNPMERWAHSPPEHEPASVTAIAKAVSSSTFSSGRDSPLTSYGHTDDGSGRSISHVSSTSSVGTSASSNGSAYSHKSRGSFGSFNSLSIGGRGRRRRRRQGPRAISPTTMKAPVRTYQCTFCTETFKTKHDWQRHEKSLHLSLERWVCSPDGPTKFNTDRNCLACVYCGLQNPSPEHAEEHNHSSCSDRPLEERTFYRKDHLRQHLNLVHDIKFQNWSMDSWKVATPQIRSRCGFCGIIMDSWSIRVEHLAEHFKGGKSMRDWKGDWGFEEQVLGIVENGMPPYLIHDERNSPNPYEATTSDELLKKTLEDRVKLWLVDYINDRVAAGATPNDDELLVEAQRIVQKVDTEDTSPEGPEVSWFRDLIMLSRPSLTSSQQSESSGTHKSPASSRASNIQLERINNQSYGNQDVTLIRCRKERALREFVKAREALGLTAADSELQIQCLKIIEDEEPKSNFQCKGAVQYFKYLIQNSTVWLSEFRRRTGLPRSDEIAFEHIRSTDDKTIDYSVHNPYRLQRELKDWVQLQRAVGKTPSDEEIQRQARITIYGNDDSWNQTVLDDESHLNAFKRQNGLAPSYDGGLPTLLESTPSSSGEQTTGESSPRTLHWDLMVRPVGLASPLSTSDRPSVSALEQPLHTIAQRQPSTNTNPVQPLRYFLNDANCYGRMAKELKRFVMSCLSPNNPLQHIPSDAEIQNQARWIIYDDDDPWNQTAADNAEWLARFKRDVGIAPAEEGPGLPQFGSPTPWAIEDGGSGFYPPYVKPKYGQTIDVEDRNVPVSVDNRVYSIRKETADRFLRDLDGGRYQPPASVFCSRELENGLNSYVEECITNRIIPTDDDLRARARKILSLDHTAADEPKLLESFKAMHVLWQAPETGTGDAAGDAPQVLSGQQADYRLPNFTNDVNMYAAFDQQLDTMDLSTDFSAGLGGLSGSAALGEQEMVSEMDSALFEFEGIVGANSGTSSALQGKPTH